MTATDELRRLLDERGVEYQSLDTSTCDFTAWHSNGVDAAWDDSENYEQPHLFIIGLTPAQAIEATLGRGTCHEIEDEDTGFIVCSECGAVHDTDYTDYYCWCCGARVVEVDE